MAEARLRLQQKWWLNANQILSQQSRKLNPAKQLQFEAQELGFAGKTIIYIGFGSSYIKVNEIYRVLIRGRDERKIQNFLRAAEVFS